MTKTYWVEVLEMEDATIDLSLVSFRLAYAAKHSKQAFAASALQESPSDENFMIEAINTSVNGIHGHCYIVAECDNGRDATVIAAWKPLGDLASKYRMMAIDTSIWSNVFKARQQISKEMFEADKLFDNPRIYMSLFIPD